jgi:hypothetical protein
MRVLLVGTLPGVIDRTEEVLRAGGHEVVHCRDEHAGTFPCNALADRGSCPFEGSRVDVVVTARDRAWPRPSPLEDGAICGIHRFVPLVVHGTTVLEPFDQWAVAETTTEHELLEAVETAADAPLPEHGAVATTTVRDLLELQGVAAEGSRVEVRRVGGRLVVTLSLTDAAAPHAAAMTVKILTALRSLDPYADGIDVVRT